jgi:hypothetical protein
LLRNTTFAFYSFVNAADLSAGFVKGRLLLSLTDRCKKLRADATVDQIYSPLNDSFLDRCKNTPRVDGLQVASAAYLYSAGYHMAQTAQGPFQSMFAADGRTVNLPGPRVRCTKTSPQQTDPPASR